MRKEDGGEKRVVERASDSVPVYYFCYCILNCNILKGIEKPWYLHCNLPFVND